MAVEWVQAYGCDTRVHQEFLMNAGTKGPIHKRDWIGLVALLDDLRNVTREIRGPCYEECS